MAINSNYKQTPFAILLILVHSKRNEFYELTPVLYTLNK